MYYDKQILYSKVIFHNFRHYLQTWKYGISVLFKLLKNIYAKADISYVIYLVVTDAGNIWSTVA